MKDINNLPTQYIITSDGHVGVITGHTKTQIIACLPWRSNVRFMKDSHRQVGTPSRYFAYVNSLSDLPKDSEKKAE